SRGPSFRFDHLRRAALRRTFRLPNALTLSHRTYPFATFTRPKIQGTISQLQTCHGVNGVRHACPPIENPVNSPFLIEPHNSSSTTRMPRSQVPLVTDSPSASKSTGER